MGNIRQINIKNRTYYLYNDQINLKDFDAGMLKIDKRNYKEKDVYYIGYVTFKEIANWNNINSANRLYLMKLQKNMKKFGKVLRKKLKWLMVAKNWILERFFKKYV